MGRFQRQEQLAWHRFATFCHDRGLPSLPASAEAVDAFEATLTGQRRYVLGLMRAIRRRHVAASAPWPRDEKKPLLQEQMDTGPAHVYRLKPDSKAMADAVYDFETFVDWLAECDVTVQHVTTADVVRFVDHLRTKHSVGTILKKITNIRRWLAQSNSIDIDIYAVRTHVAESVRVARIADPLPEVDNAATVT